MGELGVLTFIDAQLFLYQEQSSSAQQCLARMQTQIQKEAVTSSSLHCLFIADFVTKFGTGKPQQHQHNWLNQMGSEDMDSDSDNSEIGEDIPRWLDTEDSTDISQHVASGEVD